MATEKTTALLEEIKSLTILEMADLVKALEEEFGVSAAAPVAVAGGAGAAAPAEEEKTEAPAEKTEATEEAPAAEEKTVEDNVPTANEEDFEG